MGSDASTPPKPSWRMAEQYFHDGDIEIETKPHNDGYVMTIKLWAATRRVFFDPAGRITHSRPI
jgi:hypothetical protein